MIGKGRIFTATRQDSLLYSDVSVRRGVSRGPSRSIEETFGLQGPTLVRKT